MKTFLCMTAVLLSACASSVQQSGTAGADVDTASPSRAERVVQAQLEAYNRRDVQAFVATYAPTVRIYNHPDQLQLSGLDQLTEAYAKFFADSPDLHATVSTRIVQGNYVIDREHVTGLADGTEIRAVAIYEVRDDRIQAVWFIK